MLNAARLNDISATIEHARLLWKDGHHRKAIQTLEGAISANEITPVTATSVDSQAVSFLSGRGQSLNDVTARVWIFNITYTRIISKLTLTRLTLCWQNGWTEPAKHTLKQSSKDIGKLSSSILGERYSLLPTAKNLCG